MLLLQFSMVMDDAYTEYAFTLILSTCYRFISFRYENKLEEIDEIDNGWRTAS